MRSSPSFNRTGLRSTVKSSRRLASGRRTSRSPGTVGRLPSASRQLIRLFPAQKESFSTLQQLAQRALEESRVADLRPSQETYISPASGKPVPAEVASRMLSRQLYPSAVDLDSIRAANRVSANKVSIEYRGTVANTRDEELERFVKRQRAEVFRDELEQQRKEAAEAQRKRQLMIQEARAREDAALDAMNAELERRKMIEDEREKQRRQGRSIPAFGLESWQNGEQIDKLRPATIKEALLREAEIARVKMEFEKESVRIEIMKELQRRKPELRKYPELIQKKIDAVIALALKKLEIETDQSVKSLDRIFHDIKQSNRELTIAKGRAQVEIERLKAEIFNIKNNETFRLVDFLNTKRSQGKLHEPPLPGDVYYSEPVRLDLQRQKAYENPLTTDEEPIFPMDLYSRRREMKGEYKIEEDGFLSAPNRDKFSFREDFDPMQWHSGHKESNSPSRTDLLQAGRFLGSDLPGDSLFVGLPADSWD